AAAAAAAGAASASTDNRTTFAATRAAKKVSVTCEKCGATFARPIAIKKHRRSLCNTKCLDCGEVFASRHARTQHMQLQHGAVSFRAAAAANGDGRPDKARKVECEECGAMVRKDSLTKHMRRHGTDRFSCELCDRKFSVISLFKVHMRDAHGIKMHECEICKEKYNRFDELKAHRK
ncbi:hypothetical protein PFISCL1PPCAC_8833, partial [Pristionchus fissidentatus]